MGRLPEFAKPSPDEFERMSASDQCYWLGRVREEIARRERERKLQEVMMIATGVFVLALGFLAMIAPVVRG
jgi:hypothetical protein